MTERLVSVNNIVGLGEIGDRLGVGKTTVHNWTVRHADFPAPIARIGVKVNLYDMSEVTAWKVARPDVGSSGFKQGNDLNSRRKDRQEPAQGASVTPRVAPRKPAVTHRSQRGLWDDDKPFPEAPSRPSE